MNKIWVGIVLFCLFYGIVTGNTKAMVDAVLDVPYRTLDLVIKVGGLIVFYNGLFEIAIDSGLIDSFARVFRKPMQKIFPDLAPDSTAHRYICANIAANLLGLGAGATPMAINALKEMKKENENKENATHAMITLMLLNITSFTLFPATIIGIREIYKAKITME
ncbi:MAG: spore maturation protein, partial [Bacilli bacterium]|nr:spore maturation protein [Bacilli bacterium]